MSSDRMEIIPDLNEPYMVCRINTHVKEAPDQDAFIGFKAPISRDVDLANGVADVSGAIVPAHTEQLLSEKQQRQADLPDQDASTGFTAPISKDVNHADGIAEVAGAIVPASTEKSLSRKRKYHVEAPDQDASIAFTAPISRNVDDANEVAEVAGAIVPASTEKLLSRKRKYHVEAPDQDASIAFTAPISRNVDDANEVAEVAGASADTEKLFKKHRHFWEVVESFEACKKIPQNPHFLPLKSCNEVVREGQAIGKMVTFDNIAQKTKTVNLDAEREAIEDDLSLLEDLEAHGFDVKILKDRLNRILMLKNEEEKVKNMSEQRKTVLEGRVPENYKFKETRAKAEERVKELQKEVELILKMEKDLDAKKASVQQAERDNDEKRREINMQIEQLTASPLD